MSNTHERRFLALNHSTLNSTSSANRQPPLPLEDVTLTGDIPASSHIDFPCLPSIWTDRGTGPSWSRRRQTINMESQRPLAAEARISEPLSSKSMRSSRHHVFRLWSSKAHICHESMDLHRPDQEADGQQPAASATMGSDRPAPFLPCPSGARSQVPNETANLLRVRSSSEIDRLRGRRPSC